MKMKISEIRQVVQEVISEKSASMHNEPEGRKTRKMNPYQAAQAVRCRECGERLLRRPRLRTSTDQDGFDQVVPQGVYNACDGYVEGDCDYYVTGDGTREVAMGTPYPETPKPVFSDRKSLYHKRAKVP